MDFSYIHNSGKHQISPGGGRLFTPLRVGWPPTPQVLFRSVRGAKGGFPPWGLFKLRSFNKKSFQNIAFDSVFVMFPVKHTVIYTFFCYNVSPKHLFFAVFSMLWHPKTLQNLAMYNVFFHFWPFFPLPESYQNDPKIQFQYPLALRHPKILEKCRKHHRILVSVRNRFWGLVSVRNRFWAPPPS